MKQSVRVLAQNLTERQGNGATDPGVNQACQQGADTKAFTGRGRARVRRNAELDRIHEAMVELAALTTQVPGRGFYLIVHRRSSTGQHSLRWRGVAGNRHLPWASMPARFDAQLPTLATWYRMVQARVEELNRAESLARMALRQLVVKPR